MVSYLKKINDMSTYNPPSIICLTLVVPFVSALLIMGLLVEIITTAATPTYASTIDILIIDDGTYYIDDTDAESFDDYTRYNDYDDYDDYNNYRDYNDHTMNHSPYDMYDNEHNQQFRDSAGNVFNLIEQNLRLDNHNTDDGIYFQDGFQTI